MKTTILITFICFASILCIAQKKVIISGKITMAQTNTPIAGVTVFVTQNGYGEVTDSLGNYKLVLFPGSYLIEFSHQSYFKKYSKVEAKTNLVLDFVLDEKVNELEEIKVSANSSEQNVKRMGTGVTTLNAKALKKLPSLLGEVDIIKSLFTLPGVTSVGEGSSGFNVRGGNIDQNLVLLEEAPIFNSSHLLGFFSIFNPDAFRDFNFYRGGVPAQYGGRLSSVLSVNMKDANAEKITVNGGVGTISSRLMIEAPIIPNKLSFFVAGRVSYIDQALKIVKIPRLKGSKANFYDVTSKLEYKPTKKDRIALSVFYGSDAFKLANDTISAIDDNGEALYNWKTTNATLSWSHYFGSKFSFKTFGVFSRYTADITNTDTLTAFKIDNSIQYKSIKSLFLYNPSEKHEIEFGFQINDYFIDPGELTPTLPTSNKNYLKLRNERAIESSIFINDKIEFNKKLSISIGVRFANYQALGGSTVYKYEEGQARSSDAIIDSTVFSKGKVVQSYSRVEPRLSVNFNLNANSSLKLSANRMTQFLQLISSTTAALPSDSWKLSDTYIKPQLADQISFGYFRNIKEKSTESSIELFYKKLDNVVDYRDGETLFMNKYPETAILQGTGFAYGAELFVKKNLGVLTGWLSYTYSQTLIKVKGKTDEETINSGEYFPPTFNRPHSFNAIGSYQVSKRVSFSSNLNYSSGRAITYPVSKFFFGGAVLPFYKNRNQDQIPDYLRLDLSMNIETHPYKTSGYKGNWNISIYNVLARRNAYSVFFRAKTVFSQFNSRVNIYRLSILGTIIPSVTYNFKF